MPVAPPQPLPVVAPTTSPDEPPPDFDPQIQELDSAFRWSETITTASGPVKVEAGFSKACGPGAIASEKAKLRRVAWQILEHARAGNHDALKHHLVDRHKASRIIPPEPLP